MSKKTTAILSYCTIIGWVIAYIGGDKKNAKFDLNQGLVLGLAELTLGLAAALLGIAFGSFYLRVIYYVLYSFTIVPIYIGQIFCTVCSVFGIVNSARGIERDLPFVCRIHIIK